MTENNLLKDFVLLSSLNYLLFEKESKVNKYIEYVKSIEQELTYSFINEAINKIEEEYRKEPCLLREKELQHDFYIYLKSAIDKILFIENSINKKLAFQMYDLLLPENISLRNTNIEYFIVKSFTSAYDVAKDFVKESWEIDSLFNKTNELDLIDFIDIKLILDYKTRWGRQELILIDDTYYVIDLYK